MGLGEIFSNIGDILKDGLSAFIDIVKSNTKIFIIAAAALGVIIILLIILVAVTVTNPDRRDGDGLIFDATDTLLHEISPAESFFLPYEPDFVPDVMLEREPRDGWTEEDARSFWTDPLEGNESVWRRRIESGIDSLLEHIP